jgi:maleate isomerase
VTGSNRIGSRRVFGVLVPDFNSVVEPELADLRPPGVSNQTTRFALAGDVIAGIGDAAVRLAASGVEAWIVGLSTEPLPGGMALLDVGVRALVDRTSLPVHSAPHATRAAIEYLGASRIGIVTPFDDNLNANVRAVYEAWDVEVRCIVGLSRPGFDQIANTPDDKTRRAFAEVAAAGVDALVQVGGGLPTLHLIEELERRFDRPVVTANLAVYWQALRSAGIRDAIPAAGRLFAHSEDAA